MCCKKLRESLGRMYEPNENNALTIQYDDKRLVKAYCSYSEPYTNIMKRCIQKLVAVPGNILLEEDTGQTNKYSQEEFQYIKEHLKYLQSRAKKVMALQTALKDELHLLAEFGPHEEGVEMLSTVIENSVIHTGIDNNTIQCVKNCKTFENIVKKSSTSAVANVYEASRLDLVAKDLNLHIFEPVAVAMWSHPHQKVMLACKVKWLPPDADCEWIHDPEVRIQQDNNIRKERRNIQLNISAGMCTMRLNFNPSDLGPWMCKFSLKTEKGYVDLGNSSLILFNTRAGDSRLGWIVGSVTSIILFSMILAVDLVVCRG